MATNLVKSKSLEERVTEKLHEQIGELLTPEDLWNIVQKGVERALFEPRVIETATYYGTEKKTRPGIVDQLVTTLLEQKMQEAVTLWLKENPDKIQTAIDDSIRRGASNAISRTMDERFNGIFSLAISQMKSQGLLP